MPPPTLTYATPAPLPIRFGPIAFASGLLAFTSLLMFSSIFLDSRLDLSLVLQNTPHFQLLALLNSIAPLAAIILLKTARPSSPVGTAPRFHRCFAAAIILIFIHSSALVLCFFFPEGNHWFQPIPPALEIVLAVTASISVLIQLYLLIHAAFFFLSMAKLLNYGPLGTFVACAFLPNTAFLLVLFFNEFNLSRGDSDLWIFFSVFTPFHYLLLFLLWLTLALFTAILALKSPCPPASSPL